MTEYPLKTYVERRKLFLETTKQYKPTDGSKASWTKRLDDASKVVEFKNYGKKKDGGWEIDHINPKSNGGSNKASNLRALDTKKNRQKGGAVKDPYVKGRKQREKSKDM